MAIQLRQSLSLHQQLIMTPQLQQAIKLLQQSRLELLETIYQEMEVNPMLEEQAVEEVDEKKGPEVEAVKPEQSTSEVTVKEDMRTGDVDWDVYMSEYNTGWATSSFDGRETPPFESFTPSKTNLCEHLTWQFSMSDVNERQKEIGTHIIGNLDKDGYLQTSVEEIQEMTGYSLEEVVETLNLIQNFDPVGVAARDTRECLLIQARFQGLEGTIIERIILEDTKDGLYKPSGFAANTLSHYFGDQGGLLRKLGIHTVHLRGTCHFGISSRFDLEGIKVKAPKKIIEKYGL